MKTNLTAKEAFCIYLRNLQKRGRERVLLTEEGKEILNRLISPTTNFEGNSKSLEDIRKNLEEWAKKNKPSTLREKLVFSVGNPKADLILVGEAPGYDEEKLAEPFVGKAGEKLNAILKAMKIPREEIYISNIVKFRPAMENQKMQNRPPSLEEMKPFLPFIKQEIQCIQPRCIVALGKTSSYGLLEKQESIAQLRNENHSYEGIPVFVTYHPSYLLRNSARSEKRKVWEDMLKVMEYLQMPISEKQRSYFLDE